MQASQRAPATGASVRPHPGHAPAVRRAGGPQAAALALQRAAGNRAAARVLSRWTKHPDAKKKGIMVPDSVASEFAYFNPPKNE
jgi:hypothetical protein